MKCLLKSNSQSSDRCLKGKYKQTNAKQKSTRQQKKIQTLRSAKKINSTNNFTGINPRLGILNVISLRANRKLKKVELIDRPTDCALTNSYLTFHKWI